METKTRICTIKDLNEKSIFFIVLKDKNVANFKILNSSLENYILSSIDYDYEILETGKDIAIKDLKPYLDRADILFVVNVSTPLISETTIDSIIEYFLAKECKAVKLPIGFVFDTNYLKNNKNISFDATYMQNEADFLEVSDEISRQKAEGILEQRIIDYHKSCGVTFESDNVYIEPTVDIAKGVVISSNVKLMGDTSLGYNCMIKENSIISNSVLSDKCSISNSVIDNSKIGSNTVVMPYCFIQNTMVGDNVLVKSNKRIENIIIENNKTIE